MIVVFDKCTNNIEKLRDTMRYMDSDAKIVILQDSGFLPDQIISPYEYFVFGRNCESCREKELYYDFLEVPEYWEIRSVGMYAAVYDMGYKKADIYFKEPTNVQRVEWCMENGWVYKIDYYNKYALKYASEFLDVDGNVESKVIYSVKNQEVIVEQPQSDTVTLLEEGKLKRFFTSYVAFIEYYIEEIRQNEKPILFIQDKDEFWLLDLKSGGESIWKYVLFLNNELLEKYIGIGGKSGYCFYVIPEAYPVNSAKGEALILTSSDQLQGIEYLVRELPEVVFHIAASTQVSSKLYKLGEQSNVKVYPQISTQDLNDLWDKCDFYLDINYYWETYNAIDVAHQKNLLIMGFENTLHHRELVAEECIFSQVETMVLAMKELVNHAELVHKRLIRQQTRKCEVLDKLLLV